MPKGELVNKPARGIVRFFRETVAELRKVSWPTRQEATQLTVLVLVVVALSGMVLGLLDFLFTELFRLVIGM